MVLILNNKFRNVGKVQFYYGIYGELRPDFCIKSNFKSRSLRNNNPGNLRCFRTGKFRVFESIEAGYLALLRDLNLKISGKSVWTDFSTTINDFINIYAPGSENDVKAYSRKFCKETGLHATDLLNRQSAELLARGIIKLENGDLYHQLYSSKNNLGVNNHVFK
jgi:hypothetical protein